MAGGTVGFGDIYGPPAGGPSVNAGVNSSARNVGGAGGAFAALHGGGLPLGLPALVVLGLVAWWLWRVYE